MSRAWSSAQPPCCSKREINGAQKVNRARLDVQLKPHELPSIEIWSREFLLHLAVFLAQDVPLDEAEQPEDLLRRRAAVRAFLRVEWEFLDLLPLHREP